MEERNWARKISQHEFEIGFRQRFPWSDVIPDRIDWAYGSEPEYHGINPPTGEFEPDTGEEAEEGSIGKEFVNKDSESGAKVVPQRLKKENGYPCRACGKQFDYAIARAGHERQCKVGVVH